MGKDNVKEARKAAEKNEDVLYAGNVEKLNDNNKGSHEAILIITTTNAGYYKGTKVDRRYFWNQLTEIKKGESAENQVDILFGKSAGKKEVPQMIRFKSEDADKIYGIITKYLSAYLGPEEFTSYNLSGESKPTGYGIYNRYIAFHGEGKIASDPQKQVKKQLARGYKSIEIEDPKVPVDALAYALNGADFVESLTLPKIDDPYKHLKEHFPRYLQHIMFRSEKTKDFKKFCEEVKSSNDVRLIGISFVDFGFDEDTKDALLELAISRHFSSISLNNSMSQDLISSFLSDELMNTLQMLNLDKTPNLNISDLTKFNGLKSISLAYCEIEISNVLSTLSNLSKLSFLNLSGNKFSSDDGDFNFPMSLKRIDANDVTFSNECFVLFLRKVFDKRIMHVQVARANSSNFDLVFQMFDGISTTSLTEFNWSGNQVNNSLFSLVQKSPSLTTLWMRECLTDNDNLALFAQSLPYSLENLYISGSSKNSIEDFNPFFENLNVNLKILDISHNKMNSSGITALSNYLSNHSFIEAIDFDGNKITNYDSLQDLFRASENVKISWLEDDIGTFNKDQTKAITKELNRRTLGLYEVGDSDEDSAKPFELYKMEQTEPFPLYISPKIEEMFNKAPPLVSMASVKQSPSKSNSSSGKKGSSSESEDSGRISRKKGKNQDNSYSSDDQRSNKKKRQITSSSEELPKHSKRTNKKNSGYSDSDSPKPIKNKKKVQYSTDSDSPPPKPTKSKKKIQYSSDSDSPPPKPTKSKKKIQYSSDSDSPPPKPTKSNKNKKQLYSDSSEEPPSPPKKRQSNISSDSEPLPKSSKMMSKPRDKKKIYNSDSSDSEPPKPVLKSSAKQSSPSKPVIDSRPKPKATFPKRSSKNDVYEQPNWEFPPELDQKFDIEPAYHRIQKQFALSVLRDQI